VFNWYNMCANKNAIGISNREVTCSAELVGVLPEVDSTGDPSGGAKGHESMPLQIPLVQVSSVVQESSSLQAVLFGLIISLH
jgi:hypothetical protein